jgi:tRNA dimethylallyltransferase
VNGERPFPLLCILGATGTGKSGVALFLAGIFPVGIINADSRQIYADFPLITAQPGHAEQEVCPHRLYGFLPTPEKLGAGAYARRAEACVHEERAAGRLPVLVGGTGLYFRALLEGIAPIPAIPAELSARLEDRCRGEGSLALHTLLADHDPDYARKIHPRDRQRICRALAVLEHTGRTLSWWHARPLPQKPFRALKIGVTLPMPELEKRLERRIDAMLAEGAVEEARAAFERCPDPTAPGWSGIGCAELFRLLSGELSLEQCRALWRKNTRAYAKRQNTWFRADREIRCFHPEERDGIAECLAAFLRGEATESAGSGTLIKAGLRPEPRRGEMISPGPPHKYPVEISI